MKVHYNKNIVVNKAVVTIGSFDGVHYGHLAIIDTLTKKAKSVGGESVVITFSPHPRIALGLDTENLLFLNSIQEKIFLLEKAGIDHLVIMPFNKEVASQTMEQFFIGSIKNELNAIAMVVGYNHRFGSDRNSDYETLANLAEKEGIEIIRIGKQGVDERDISSTTIRNLLKMGDMQRVNKYLSHPYLFISDIDNLGTVLYYEQKKLYPPKGDYEVKVESDGYSFNSTAHICGANAMTIDNITTDIKDAKIYFLSKK